MAGLALLLARNGWQVDGCDLEENECVAWLRSHGIPVGIGHDPGHLRTLDPASAWVVRSAAVPSNHPELAEAAARELAVFDRGVVLAAFLGSIDRTVAVCGSHGKTTTATFTTLLLRALGADPGWCIGGTCGRLGAVAAFDAGHPDAPLVAECDESDGTLSLYHPRVTVVTNVDYDHMEHFDGMHALEAVFARVARQTRETVVYVRDDVRAHALCSGLCRTFSVGLHPDADLRAEVEEATAEGTVMRLLLGGEDLGRWRLGVPGPHNVTNALAALGAVQALGCDLRAAADCMADGLCLPARRFDCVSTRDAIRVISDYAHHPAEVTALVRTARMQPQRRIVAIFQPHRHTRTRALSDQFPAAFAQVSALALLPVYAASEPPLEGGTSADLYRQFRKAAAADPTLPVPVLARTLESGWHWLRTTVRPGDLVLIVGAGDVVKLADRIRGDGAWCADALQFATADGLSFEPDARTESLVTYGVGGRARGLACVSSKAALRMVLEECARRTLPWSMLGAGSNLLVSDAGYPGVLIQLRGRAFRKLAPEPSSAPDCFAVGAGWPGAALLNRLQELGLGGLEFMEGIPGTFGGWLAMNAGAHGGAVADVVEAVEVVDGRGAVRRLEREALGFSYRCCEALRSSAAIAGIVRLQASTSAEISARRADYRVRRICLAGLRTAGSVFRNPPGDSAGRILDLAGCKGMRVGEAEITTRHANVIAAHPGATASDILALAARASQQSSVPLELELRILD